MDSIKDHLIPNISELESAKQMYDTLVKLESKNTNWKIALRNQLRGATTYKSESVATLFMRVSQIRDQLKAIGEKIDYEELVSIILNAFSDSWEPFVQGMFARPEMSSFDQLK